MFGFIVRHGENHLVKHFGRTLDHVEVAVGDRIKAPGIHDGSHGQTIAVLGKNGKVPPYQVFDLPH